MLMEIKEGIKNMPKGYHKWLDKCKMNNLRNYYKCKM